MLRPNKKTGNVKNHKVYQNLEEKDKILFDSRSKPLKVIDIQENQIKIEGPSEGQYILFVAEEKNRVLISKEDKRDYASYVENLRKIGEWQKTGDKSWKHSKSKADIRLEQKETGYWTIKTEDFNLEKEINLPLYGYSNRELAEEEVKKFINNHPEG